MVKKSSKKSKYSSLILSIILITTFTVSCGNKQEQLEKKVTSETSRSIFGAIKSIDKNTRTIGFDDLELITADKKERMNEIGITDKDFSNYYIYNASKEIKIYKIKNNATIIIFKKDSLNKISTDINGLYDQVNSGYENNYDIKIEGDYIVEIVQHLLEP